MSKIILPFGIEVPKFLKNIFDSKLSFDKNNKEKIYVIGNGWGSYFFVKNLDKSKFEPVIIAPNKKVLNTPRLVNLLTEPNAQVEFENPYGEIIEDMLEDIDLDGKELITKSGIKYPYTKLVLSIGSEPNDFGIQGVNTYTYKFKTIKDANLLREKISTMGINNQVFVVGSGITGIEIASKIGNIFNVTVIEGMGIILPGYNDNTKNVIMEHLNKNQKYIDIVTNTFVKFIGNNHIRINKTKSNELIDLSFDNKKDLIIWSGGVRINGYGQKTKLFNKLNSIIQNIECDKTISIKTTSIKPRGLDVEEDFKIKSDLDIYCIGDMVANKGPSSAQNARVQGEWLANYFNSGFDKEFLRTNKYEIKSRGKLVHLINDIYLESEYYSGFIPKFIDKIIEWINI